MSGQKVLEIQQGVWIGEQWIRSAGLGPHLQVIVQPGEIRILPGLRPEPEPSRKGWDTLRSLGRDAQPGRLPNAAVEHDRYLYGTGS